MSAPAQAEACAEPASGTAVAPPGSRATVPPLGSLRDAERFLYTELASTPARRGGYGLARARALFGALDDPQDRFRAIHIAGTAGKGSVVAFVAGMLGAHGFRVGAHLSPHAHSILERFQLDGRPVEAPLFLRTLAAVAPAIDAVSRSPLGPPTFFEVTNAVAWRLLADHRVDYGVIETGLGGRLDSTNTISRPDKLAVITRIGLDHTEVLGDTVEQIAREKAGILPRHGNAIALRPDAPAVTDVLVDEAARRRCGLELVDPGDTPWSPDLGLTCPQHAANAAIAVRAVTKLAARDGWAIDPVRIRQVLRHVRLPGRFERRSWNGRDVVLDGAHNPLKLTSVVAALHAAHPGGRFVWVLAFKSTKDVPAALNVIAPTAAAVVATRFETAGGDSPAGASVAPGAVAEAARRAGVPISTTASSPIKALATAIDVSADDLPVVVAGSFHLVEAVGAAMAVPSSGPDLSADLVAPMSPMDRGAS